MGMESKIDWDVAVSTVAAVLMWGSLFGATPSVAQSFGEVRTVRHGEAYCGEADMNLGQPYTCIEVVVGCDDRTTPLLEAEDRPVQLRVTEPPVGTPIRGTVVFGLGGTGRVFYENAQLESSDDRPAAEMLDRLNLEGYRVIQRAWRDRPNFEPGGWISGSISLQTSACRYATLLDWISQQPLLHDSASQAFCAAGNSGAASEIGYALATYGLGDRIDLAILSGGVPHGRIDGGCDPSSVVWENECNANLEALGVCPQLGPDDHNCFFDDRSIEVNVDPAFDLNLPPADMPCTDADASVLIANSVQSPGAVVDYPQTNTVFLIGKNDCGTTPAMGSPYILSVLGESTGPARREILPGVGHGLPAYPSGAAAVGRTILASDGCVKRH